MAVVSPTPSRSIVAVGRGALPDSVIDQRFTESGRAVAARSPPPALFYKTVFQGVYDNI
jgi:hypothetical protein